MAESIRNLVTNEQKLALKAIKNIKTPDMLVEKTRNVLSVGCLEQSAYVQFGSDVPVYGLWEALLYAELYEHRDHAYVPGTVERACKAAVGEMSERSA